MKLRLTAVFCIVLLAATFAFAQETVLMPNGTVYAIDATASGAQLELSRRRGDVRETLAVPTTGDEAIESQARLAYDATSNTMYVLWHRAAEGVDEIRLASMNEAEEWSEPQTVAGGADARRLGLHMVLTHAREDGDEFETTLVHVAWWSLGADAAKPEYALLAFDHGQHVSTELLDLSSLKIASLVQDKGAADEPEETGDAVHPPMFMARAENGHDNGVDVVFGAPRTTSVTRVRIQPTRISSEARIWRPSGRMVQKTPPARFTSLGTDPVQTFIKGDRLVLYTPDAKFRYSIFDNGEWTPIRMIGLDEHVTKDHVLRELQRTVEESTTVDVQPQE
jgi:hypothetical protein